MKQLITQHKDYWIATSKAPSEKLEKRVKAIAGISFCVPFGRYHIMFNIGEAFDERKVAADVQSVCEELSRE